MRQRYFCNVNGEISANFSIIKIYFIMENENQDKTPQPDAEAREQPALSPEMAENVKQLVKDLLEEQLADTRIEAYRQGLNERIDALLHDLPALNDDGTTADAREDSSPLPRLTRRSIWTSD